MHAKSQYQSAPSSEPPFQSNGVLCWCSSVSYAMNVLCGVVLSSYTRTRIILLGVMKLKYTISHNEYLMAIL